MKAFNGEARRKARYLRGVIQNGGLIHNIAVFAGISFERDHRQWMASDPIYRQAFNYAVTEAERRWEQHLFNILCDAVRQGDSQTEHWLAERCGDQTISIIKQGYYPRRK